VHCERAIKIKRQRIEARITALAPWLMADRRVKLALDMAYRSGSGD